jgi:hypothetical protein
MADEPFAVFLEHPLDPVNLQNIDANSKNHVL